MCAFHPRLEGVEARLQESSEAFEKSREMTKKSKIEYEKVKKMRYIRIVMTWLLRGCFVSDMTVFKMPLNMFQLLLMISTRYNNNYVYIHVLDISLYVMNMFDLYIM